MWKDQNVTSQMPGIAMGAERAPEVQSAIQSLMHTTERLNGIAERLGSSLTPVLRCETTQSCNQLAGGQAMPDVPMANRLREIDTMCMRAEDILNDVHRRLEI